MKGDSKVQAISAASILAKVARDAELYELDKQYPQYGFAKHKGYPSPAHLLALQAHGICPQHRLSYAPVKALVAKLQSNNHTLVYEVGVHFICYSHCFYSIPACR